MKKLIALAVGLLTLVTSAFAQIGSLSSDLVFTPVTPCRIMDTRNAGSKSGILAAGSTRGFYAWASFYTDQGGAATSCNALFGVNEAAIVVNFTVVTPDTAGYITAYPADLAVRPTAATVNFAAGAVVGNNATLKVAQVASGDGFKIYTTSNTHVVADIVGYYSKPVVTPLQVTEVSTSTNQTGEFSVTSGVCPTGYSVTGSGHNWFGGATDVWFWQVSPRTALNDVVCRGTVNRGGATSTITCLAVCSQIPGR
jgi:hypothetical protein